MTDLKEAEFFESKIRPILAARCFECHGHEKRKSGLRLDSRQALVEGGDSGPAFDAEEPDRSLLLNVIGYTGDIKMPPKSKLPDQEIALLTAWVKRGAPWPNPESEVSKPRSPSDLGPLFTPEQKAFWAFQPPLEPAVPVVRDAAWPRSTLDRFVLAGLEVKGFHPAPPADKRTLIRRATFDLTGLPPTVAEIDAFLADDASDAFAKVVDRLLASPRYGERWGRHWLDIARYSDSNGLDENLAYGNAYLYRDYVISAFNVDKPYDQFIREQLAGDLLPSVSDSQTDFERWTATGFLALGAKMLAEDDPVKMQMDIIDEQVDTVGRAFMGLTLGCARCHDHKFDPIPTEDYYSLAGIFKSTKTMENFKVVARWQERPLATTEELQRRDAQTAAIKASQERIAKFVEESNRRVFGQASEHTADHLLLATERWQRDERSQEAKASPSDGDYEPHPAILTQWTQYLEKTKSDRASPFAIWHAKMSAAEGAPLPAELPKSVTALFEDWRSLSRKELAGRYQELFERAASAWKTLKGSDAGKDAKSLPDEALEAFRRIQDDPNGPFAMPKNAESYYPAETAAELKRQRDELVALEKAAPRFREAMSVTDATPENLKVHLRGSHLTLGKETPRQFPRILAGEAQSPIDASQSGRLELANWLTSPDHPLVARVMVNRVWQGHFGEGLLRSPDNFGRLGERPSHPELLDWLARRFIEGGWSLKKLHRSIMLSATYGMSTAYDADAALADPANRLLWRMNRRRLEAEEVRDAILAVSGNLDLTMGGSLLPTPNRQYVTSTASVDPVLYDVNRRSIYLPVIRSALFDVFQAFDFADPSVLNGRRETTTVAPQALFMMNSKLVSKATKALAAGLLEDHSLVDSARVRMAYVKTYGRPPSQAESERALAYVGLYVNAASSASATPEETRLLGWQSLCRALLSANEFIYVE